MYRRVSKTLRDRRRRAKEGKHGIHSTCKRKRGKSRIAPEFSSIGSGDLPNAAGQLWSVDRRKRTKHEDFERSTLMGCDVYVYDEHLNPEPSATIEILETDSWGVKVDYKM